MGPTGEELSNSLTQAELLRRNLFLVNATCCRPPEGVTEPMKAKAVASCRGALLAQLKPRLRVPMFLMGKWAAVTVLGREKSIMDGRGFVRHGAQVEGLPGKRSVIISWHPTFAFFHNPYSWAAFDIDLARFGRLIRGTLEKPPAGRDLLIHPTLADVRRLVSESPFIAVDIETAPEHPSRPWTGKDPTRARLKTVGMGNTKWGLSHWWGGDKRVEMGMKKILEDPKILKVGQNWAYFDDRVLRRYGIRPVNFEDTRDLRRSLSATSSLKLAYLASIYTDFPAWKEAEDEK